MTPMHDKGYMIHGSDIRKKHWPGIGVRTLAGRDYEFWKNFVMKFGQCEEICPCWRCTNRAECDIIDKCSDCRPLVLIFCSDYAPALQGVRV